MKLNQITVPSKDLSVSVPFYQKLGLQLIVDALPNYARFQCPEGGATFSIHKVAELPEGEGVYVYFEHEQLDAYVEELKEKRISFDLEPTDQTWLWREARLKDPDGIQLILYYAGKNRCNPPWRIG